MGASAASGADLARAFGEASLTTDATKADYFTFVTPDSSTFDYVSATRKIRILEVGTYVAFDGWNFSTSNANPAVTERAVIIPGYTGPGGNDLSHRVQPMIQQYTVAGVLDRNGTTKHWDAFDVELMSLSATELPTERSLTANKSGATNMPGDLETTIIRIAETDMGQIV